MRMLNIYLRIVNKYLAYSYYNEEIYLGKGPGPNNPVPLIPPLPFTIFLNIHH